MLAKQHGFTLIEIMLVIVITGITLTFALMAFGDFSQNRQAIISVEQFSAYLKLVQQQAILQADTLKVKISNKGYGTYTLDNRPRQQGIFRWRSFPAHLVVSWRKQGKNRDIFIDPGGEMSKFELDFGTEKKPLLITLVGKPNGTLLLQRYPTKN